MKEKTEKILKGIIESGVFVKNIPDLFDVYTEFEITKYEDIFNCKKDFSTFIVNNKRWFVDYSTDCEKEIKHLASDVSLNLTYFGIKFSNKVRCDNEIFADNVLHIMEGNGLHKVLDVGCGAMALSSIYLAKNGVEVSCVDPKLVLSKQTLKNLGVKSYKCKFSEIDFSNYDLVVAKSPCPSIEELVLTCEKYGAPFFIELCDCNAPDKNKELWLPILNCESERKHFGPYIFSEDLKIDKTKLQNTKQTLHDVIMQNLL